MKLRYPLHSHLRPQMCCTLSCMAWYRVWRMFVAAELCSSGLIRCQFELGFSEDDSKPLQRIL